MQLPVVQAHIRYIHEPSNYANAVMVFGPPPIPDLSDYDEMTVDDIPRLKADMEARELSVIDINDQSRVVAFLFGFMLIAPIREGDPTLEIFKQEVLSHQDLPYAETKTFVENMMIAYSAEGYELTLENN